MQPSDEMNPIWFDTFDSVIGPLTAAADFDGLRWLLLPQRRWDPERIHWRRDPAPFSALRRQLKDYFAGTLRDFDLPLVPRGTPFQCAAWAVLRTIPYGETRSYREQAQAIGNPRSVRAIGLANRCNPLPILIPCHRVIGSNGSLIGYSGGIAIKRFLLELEARHAGNVSQRRTSRRIVST